MRLKSFLRAALAGGALIVFTLSAEAANPRIALVIGEQAYADAQLPTAANDAGLVAQVLQAAGFDVVGARDLDQKSVREALRDFLDKANAAGPDMQAFVYFAGRGLQYGGDNYLVPIDARIARASDAPIEAVKLSDFTHALASAPGLARVVVVDGARANPYAQQGEPLAGGLALIDPETNTIVAFNAAPGAIGGDEAPGYGIYAKTLAGFLRQGGVDVRDVLGQTRLAVNEKTQGAQIPWSAGKLDAPYFLFEQAADAPPVVVKRPPTKKPLKELSAEDAYEVAVDRDTLQSYEEFLRAHERSKQAKRIEAIVAARREALFWRRTLDQNSPRAYWTYLRRYPKGPHASDAGWRLDSISARREPPPDFRVMEYEDLPPPPREEMIYADRPVYYFGGDDFGPPPPRPPREYYVEDDDDWRDLPPPPPPTVAGMLPALAIAIPLALTVRAYNDRPRADGRAPPSAPPPAPRPFAPPPLPKGVQVQATPAPAGGKPAAPPAGGQPVPPPAGAKPLAPTPSPGATPPPAVKPITPPATPVPAPATGGKPLAPPPSPTSPPETGGKPLTPPPAPVPTPATAGKPLAPPPAPVPTPATGGKPLAPPPAPVPTPATGGKPLAPPPAPVPTPATGGKPLAPPPAPPIAPTPTSAPAPAAEKSTPKDLSATPEAKPAGEMRKHERPAKPTDAPTGLKTDSGDLKPAPKALDQGRPAPPPKPEATKAIEAPKAPPEAPKPPPPAPKPPPEAPKPPPPAPKPPPEAPKPPPPAPKPPPEAPKPPPPGAGKPPGAACGHPGQPPC